MEIFVISMGIYMFLNTCKSYAKTLRIEELEGKKQTLGNFGHMMVIIILTCGNLIFWIGLTIGIKYIMGK